MEHSEVIIIGAGISGLICARELTRQGCRVRVLDKGRGLGGRMATRRMAGARLDHGAQFFTVRDPRFQAVADEALEAGVIKEWFRNLPEDETTEGHPRYCGRQGMTDLPKFLARGIDIRCEQTIVDLERQDGGWTVRSAKGDSFFAPTLILTAPLPQTLALLKTSRQDFAGTELEGLRQINYAKSLAVLAVLDGPSGLPGPGARKLSDEPLTWIADNRAKGLPGEVPTVTLHTTARFAERHWDAPDSERLPILLEAARPHLHAKMIEHRCHRWGFAFPVNPWPEPCFHNQALRLALAGDAFGGPRVEGAALSGLAAAECVL